MAHIGVLLLNLGGPDSLDAVRPFLYNLFSDREIIRLGPPLMQKPLAWLIATLRSKKTERYYRMIGGRSPILDITRAQATALEKALNRKSEKANDTSNPPLPPLSKGGNGGITNNKPHHYAGSAFKVYVGMRYWRPFIDDVLFEMHKNGIEKVIALSLYPQYSVTTSGSSARRVDRVAADYPIEVHHISSWHNHPLYIEALANVIKKGLESFLASSSVPHPASADDIHLLFSAHSLPRKIIDEGDPYEQQTIETVQEVVKKVPLKWHLSYQSKSGPVKWLEPSTEEKLKELAHEGVKNVLVVPISFVSDHIETLYEIDILYKTMAGKLGMNLKRTDSLNTHPLFINALEDIIVKGLQEKGWDKTTALP
jgi:protoporphyrin/coproporphyrin ferrochelatase